MTQTHEDLRKLLCLFDKRFHQARNEYAIHYRICFNSLSDTFTAHACYSQFIQEAIFYNYVFFCEYVDVDLAFYASASVVETHPDCKFKSLFVLDSYTPITQIIREQCSPE